MRSEGVVVLSAACAVGTVGGMWWWFVGLKRRKRRRRYAVVGDAFVDVLAPGVKRLPSWNQDALASSPVALHPGGSALNTSVHLKALGERCDEVTLHTALGDDGFGRFLEASARDRGVGVANHVAPKGAKGTGACVVISGQADRAFVTHRGVVATFAAPVSVCKNVDHVHIGGYYNCPKLQAAVPDLVRAARANGATSSLGVQHDASGAWAGVARAPLLSDDAAPDFLLLSEDEASAIRQSVLASEAVRAEASVFIDDVVRAAEDDARFLLDRGAAFSAVVVTVGDQGAVAAARHPDGGVIVLHQRAAPLAAFVDATGAGDAFAAGFVHGVTTSNASLRKALVFGCAAGAACVANLGASAPLDANLVATLSALRPDLDPSRPDLLFVPP